MAVFRVQKNQNYTVMSNFHLRDTSLSLKAVGLLSKMLSLKEDWDYNIRGLASICKEGVDAIGSALKELEKRGYLVRNQIRDSKGRICDTEYMIYESPRSQEDKVVYDGIEPDSDAADMTGPDAVRPDMSKPGLWEPHMEKSDMDKPHMKKTAQLNKDKSSIYKSNTDLLSMNQSNPTLRAFDVQKNVYAGEVDQDEMGYEETEEEVRLNIEYEILAQ